MKWCLRQKYCLVVLFGLLGHIYGETLNLGGFQITWTNRGQQTDFVVTSPLGNGITASSAWIGIGLNSSPMMNGASVVICTNSASGTAVQHNYNANYNTLVLDSSNRQLGLSNVAVVSVNGNLACSFTRDNSNANANYFNLNQNTLPYVIVGYGPLSSTGDLIYHTFRAISSNGISFAAPATTTTTLAPQTTTTKTSPSPMTSTAAATTVSQYPEIGSFQSGDFNVNWRKSNSMTNALDFTVSYLTASMLNIYVAIGFSKDSTMGDDDVYACVYATNVKEVGRFYNPSGHMSPIRQANNNGILNSMISLNNGKLSCTFTRIMALTMEPNYFDLNTPHFLLVAAGNTNDAGGLMRHSARFPSSTALNFQPKSETSPTSAVPTTTSTATIPVVTSPAQTTTSTKPASTSILTTITQTVPSTTPKPNPVVYFSTLIKNFWTKLLQLFGSKS